MCILERFKILKSWCILASLAVAWDISTTRTSSLSHNRSTTHTSCCRMWIGITQNYKMESLAFLSYKLIKTMFLTKAYKSLQKPTKPNTAFPSGYLIVSNVFFVGVSKNLGRFYQCKLPLHPSKEQHTSTSLSSPVSTSVAQQLKTVFLDIKIKLTQKIFLNRARGLNWQCYKYYRTKVYFCLYFSLPDTAKPTVHTQTSLLLLSRRVCNFFRTILNSVPYFT